MALTENPRDSFIVDAQGVVQIAPADQESGAPDE